MSDYCSCNRPSTRLLNRARDHNEFCNICYFPFQSDPETTVDSDSRSLSGSEWDDTDSETYEPSDQDSLSTDSLEYTESSNSSGRTGHRLWTEVTG